MTKDQKPKALRLKLGDIRVKTRVDLTPVVLKDKRDVWPLKYVQGAISHGTLRLANVGEFVRGSEKPNAM